MKSRDSNFELLRIVSMMMIVLWHILMHGNVIINCTNDALKIILALIFFSLAAHVNSFILVMGYYQSKSKFKFRKLLSIIFQTIFYSIIVLTVGIYMGWIEDPNIVTLIKFVLPEAISNYWFIGCYLLVYVFSDYLNFLINKLSKIQLRNLLIICFLVFSISPFLTGYVIVNTSYANIGMFVTLYLLGGYFRLYPLKENKLFNNISITNYRLILIGLFIFSFVSNYLVYKFGLSIDGMSNLMDDLSRRLVAANLTRYSNPFIFIQSVVYFELFNTLSFKNKFVNYISSCTFGIYLFHDHPVFRNNIYKLIGIDNGNFGSYKYLIYIIVLMLLIFIAGLLVESFRKLLVFIYHKTKISKKISNNNEKILKQINNNLTY